MKQTAINNCIIVGYVALMWVFISCSLSPAAQQFYDFLDGVK